MNISTAVKYLFGDREATREIATHPAGLTVGLLLVLGAGLAREYDQEYLLREPWHALLPLFVSSLLALVLATIFWLMRPETGQIRPKFLSTLRMFATLIWMMSPMAWLYAVPFERFMDAGPAMAANLWTLAIVALWRVVLLTRVVSVVLNMRGGIAFSIVAFLASGLLLVALMVIPLPVLSIMGGIQLSEADRALAGATFFAMTITMFGTPVFAVCALVASIAGRPDWTLAREQFEFTMGGLLKPAACAALVGGAAALPLTQPEQARRWEAETLLRSGRLAEAVTYMSRFTPPDFPPHWDPPPRAGYRQAQPEECDIVQAIVNDADVADWVRRTFVDKLATSLRHELLMWRTDWASEEARMDEHWIGQYHARWQRQVPALRLLLAADSTLSADDRAAIERIIERVERGEPAATRPGV